MKQFQGTGAQMIWMEAQTTQAVKEGNQLGPQIKFEIGRLNAESFPNPTSPGITEELFLPDLVLQNVRGLGFGITGQFAAQFRPGQGPFCQGVLEQNADVFLHWPIPKPILQASIFGKLPENFGCDLPTQVVGQFFHADIAEGTGQQCANSGSGQRLGTVL
jgi:hypothetical protein